MNDDAILAVRVITTQPPLGVMHDDSARLYADPVEMDAYLAVLDTSGSLRCVHETPRHLDCTDCTADDTRETTR